MLSQKIMYKTCIKDILDSYIQWRRFMLSIGVGDNLQFYPNFALFSTLGGDEAQPLFFHVSKSSEDQTNKKKPSPKIEEFLSPKSSEDQTESPKIIQRSDADHSQIIGGDAVKLYWGGYIPLPISAPLLIFDWKIKR